MNEYLDRIVGTRQQLIEGDLRVFYVAWREMLTAFLQPLESNPQRPRRLEVPRPEFRRRGASC